MKEDKKLTGYPSIDKPWLKYYSVEAINAPLPECTIYEYLWENNKDYPKDIALEYLGSAISYTASSTLTQEIIKNCKDALPEYMVPEAVEYRTDLPRTERGKVDYRALEKEEAEK